MSFGKNLGKQICQNGTWYFFTDIIIISKKWDFEKN